MVRKGEIKNNVRLDTVFRMLFDGIILHWDCPTKSRYEERVSERGGVVVWLQEGVQTRGKKEVSAREPRGA